MTSKFKQRLKRLHDSRLRAAEASDAPNSPRVYLADDALEQEKIAPALAVEESIEEGVSELEQSIEENEEGRFRLLAHLYEDDHCHGNYVLGACRECAFERLSALTASARFEGFQPEDILYLDIETSGLGRDSYAFCVGLGFWSEGGFLVEQYVMQDAESEAAMLAGVAKRVLAARGLCTFNGQKFDVARLEDRFRHVGIASPFGHLHRQHADLLPMSRRRLKGYPSYRLGALEESVLGLFRVDDVPGRQIPPLWKRYLKTGEEHLLEGVFEHNRIDIVTMPVLLSVLLQGVSASPKPMEAGLGPVSSFLPPVTSHSQGSVAKRLQRSYALRDRNAKAGVGSEPRKPQRSASEISGHQVSGSDGGYATIGERAQVLREAATILIGRGQTSEALPMLFELAALSPENPFPLEHLARYYRSIGNQVFAEHFERRLRASVSF